MKIIVNHRIEEDHKNMRVIAKLIVVVRQSRMFLGAELLYESLCP